MSLRRIPGRRSQGSRRTARTTQMTVVAPETKMPTRHEGVRAASRRCRARPGMPGGRSQRSRRAARTTQMGVMPPERSQSAAKMPLFREGILRGAGILRSSGPARRHIGWPRRPDWTRLNAVLKRAKLERGDAVANSPPRKLHRERMDNGRVRYAMDGWWSHRGRRSGAGVVWAQGAGGASQLGFAERSVLVAAANQCRHVATQASTRA